MAKSMFSKGVTVLLFASVITTLFLSSLMVRDGHLSDGGLFYGFNGTTAILMLFLAFSLMATGCKSKKKNHYAYTIYCNSSVLILVLVIVAATVIINASTVNDQQRGSIRDVRQLIIQYALLWTEVTSLIYLIVVAGIMCGRAQTLNSNDEEGTDEHCFGVGESISDIEKNNLNSDL